MRIFCYSFLICHYIPELYYKLVHQVWFLSVCLLCNCRTFNFLHSTTAVAVEILYHSVLYLRGRAEALSVAETSRLQNQDIFSCG